MIEVLRRIVVGIYRHLDNQKRKLSLDYEDDFRQVVQTSDTTPNGPSTDSTRPNNQILLRYVTPVCKPFSVILNLIADREETAVATVIIRGSTENIMDDIERAVDDGVNTFKALSRDDRFVPGAGATEIELAKQISSFGEVNWLVNQPTLRKQLFFKPFG